MGSTYYIKCKTCKEHIDPEIIDKPAVPGGIKSPNYIGMSATSLHARHKDHRKGHNARNKNNCLVKHEFEAHNGEKQQYIAGFINRQRGLLHLSLMEALLIEGQLAGTSLNDRKEKGRSTGIIRINTGIT